LEEHNGSLAKVVARVDTLKVGLESTCVNNIPYGGTKRACMISLEHLDSHVCLAPLNGDGGGDGWKVCLARGLSTTLSSKATLE